MVNQSPGHFYVRQDPPLAGSGLLWLPSAQVIFLAGRGLLRPTESSTRQGPPPTDSLSTRQGPPLIDRVPQPDRGLLLLTVSLPGGGLLRQTEKNPSASGANRY